MTVQPDATRKSLINTAIVGLQAAGLWTKCDALYVVAAHTEQAAQLNWKVPGTRTLTKVNTPTFTVDRGYTGNGSNTGIHSNVNVAIYASAYTQNSCHIACWNLTNTDANVGDVGDGVGNLHINARTTNEIRGRVQDATGFPAGIANTDSRGHYLLSRTASNLTTFYKNAGSLGTHANASVAINASMKFELGWAPALTSSTNRQQAAFSLGAGLNGTEVTAFYNILLAYLQGVGAV